MSEPKRWKTVKTLSNYEDASSLKSKLLSEDKTSTLQVKIKRCGEGGANFKVKFWMPREEKPKNKITKKKKGKRNER